MKRPRGWEPLLWLVFAAVLATTVSALIPIRGPKLPGTLHVFLPIAAMDTPSRAASEPFVAYLGQSLRRASVLVTAGGGDPDVALVPARQVDDGAMVLAWIKPLGRAGHRDSLMLLSRSDVELSSLAPLRVVWGDSTLLAQPQDSAELLRDRIGPATVMVASAGRSCLDHGEAIAALLHGAYDAAVVWNSDFQLARMRGLWDERLFDAEQLGEVGPRMAVVAGASLSESARRRVRDAILHLDDYRLDSGHVAARAAMAGLARIGIGGFAPVESFAGLRP